jgi:hypothetical protein
MMTKKKLNEDILKISTEILSNYPEISFHLSEMPETIPNEASPKISIETLTNYRESLTVLLKDYLKNRKIPAD